VNHIKKTIKFQQNRITKKLKAEGTNGFYNLLAQERIKGDRNKRGQASLI